MASVAAQYLPILLFLGVALLLSTAFVFLPMVVVAADRIAQAVRRQARPNMSAASPRSRTAARSSTCASTSSRSCSSSSISRRRSSIPWAVSLREIGWTGWVAMMVFLAELLLGFAYAWKKGALEWE